MPRGFVFGAGLGQRELLSEAPFCNGVGAKVSCGAAVLAARDCVLRVGVPTGYLEIHLHWFHP